MSKGIVCGVGFFVIVAGSSVQADCLSGTCKSHEQFEAFLKAEKDSVVIKKRCSNLVKRAAATWEDQEVIAARIQFYKASKKLKNVITQKMALSEEDLALVERVMDVMTKQQEGRTLTDDDKAVLIAFKVLVVELSQDLSEETVRNMLLNEIGLFERC